jgi:hypothetical protein
MDVAAMAKNTSSPNKVPHFRRRSGRQKKNSVASATPPEQVKIRFSGLWSAAVDAAVVLIVRLAVTAAVPEMAAGEMVEQVGTSTEPDGAAVTAHVSTTLPVNPPLGVIVMVEVPVAPGDAMLIGEPLSVKVVGKIGLTTIIATLVDSAMLPELPATVAV